MASAANLFNLDNIAEHHETDSGHSSEVDEQEDNVFSANEPGKQGALPFLQLCEYPTTLNGIV